MSSQRVLITGGTGLIGRPLALSLAGSGYEVIVLTRNPDSARGLFEGHCRLERWDGRTAEGWGGLADGALAIVNLAGDNLGRGRWTKAKKDRIIRSRIEAGAAVVDAVRAAAAKPSVVIQSSASGYYGPHRDEELDETAPSGTGFLAGVCRRWEESTRALEAWGVRRVITRTGVVLGPGGALPRLALPFRFFIGGPIGSGRQWFPWIHLQDDIAAIRFLLERGDLSGVFVLTSPVPVREKEFCRALGAAMGRPCWVPVPGLLLRLLYGHKAKDTLLSGQRLVPRRLLEAGFRFAFPDAGSALANLFGKNA
jgi:uncharacterized protein (TIGR01777 family)